MFKLFRFPISLRARFLLATSMVILALSLAYGAVAVIGYVVSFDKHTFRLLRTESNLFFNLAQWHDNTLTITMPPNGDLNFPTLVFIYDEHGKLLWSQRRVPDLEKLIDKSWLQQTGFYEVDTDSQVSEKVLENNPQLLNQLRDYDDNSPGAMTHSIVVNTYAATEKLPALSIVVVDTIPQELQRSGLVWNWFSYVLLANILLVLPLMWLAAYWSLKPIQNIAHQIGELEQGERQQLDEAPPAELRGLVLNLNTLLRHERKRYSKYRTSLADLTHSLKTPLAVLQTTLRSLRDSKQTTIEQAEPVMLEQIGRISQQIGYYLHRASIQDEHTTLTRELSSVSALLDSLCSALNKVYRPKGVAITLNISPEIMFLGEKNDFLEVCGNVLDNACKYCLEFIEVSATVQNKTLIITIDDDGPGVRPDLRQMIFQRGERVDTLTPGQGLGLSIATDIVEQYQGGITIVDSQLGGAKVIITFGEQ